MNLDEAIQKFAAYARGEGDFDELDLKEVIYDQITNELLELATGDKLKQAGYEYVKERVAIFNGTNDLIEILKGTK